MQLCHKGLSWICEHFALLVKQRILTNGHVLFEWMPRAKGMGDMSALTPARTLPPFSTLHGECEKKGEDREERQSEREREAAFVTAETTVFVPQHHGGTRATNVKQTKTRGTSMPYTYTHTPTQTVLPSGETQELESDSGDLSVLEEDRGKSRNKQCNCVHVCHYTLACLQSRKHMHTQWRQTDCGWYHYSKHRWQKGQIDGSLIEHTHPHGCVRKSVGARGA